MSKVIMLFLAFTITDPDGIDLDEQFHVMAKRFDTVEKCTSFVADWGGLIKDRGVQAATDLIKNGYTINLDEIGCVNRKVFQ
tara:strand:+ start:616 stop:861 length:246 start_codon:yes stop_codon:yes gene_type:complete